MRIKSYKNLKTRELRIKRTINDKWYNPKQLVGVAIFLAASLSEYIKDKILLLRGVGVQKDYE